MSKYSINDLEKITGIKAHTIRIWEKRYGLVEPHRTTTNIRYYTSAHLKKLMNVSILNRNGFKISDIASYGEKELIDRVRNLTLQACDHSVHVDSLTLSMIELDEDRFENVMSNLILQLGFEETLLKVVYPFFERVGILWHTDAISPLNEHFISNLMRQKLIVAINNISNSPKPGAKTFLLFLHENEWHENGLLVYYYFIKKHGHKAIYLGQSVPFEDLLNYSQQHQTDCLVSFFTTSLYQDDLLTSLSDLQNAFTDSSLIISGMQAIENKNILPDGIILSESLNDFKKILEEMDAIVAV